MKKLLFLITAIFISFSCSNEALDENQNNVQSFVFVACEGNFGASNGSVHYFNQSGDIFSVDNIGDIVQSLEVYNDKLFVIVNNSHKIIAYYITENGLSLPGIEVSTNGSSPREMVIVDDYLYFCLLYTSPSPRD